MSAAYIAALLTMLTGPGGRSNVPEGLLWAPPVSPLCIFGESFTQDADGYIVSLELEFSPDCGATR